LSNNLISYSNQMSETISTYSTVEIKMLPKLSFSSPDKCPLGDMMSCGSEVQRSPPSRSIIRVDPDGGWRRRRSLKLWFLTQHWHGWSPRKTYLPWNLQSMFYRASLENRFTFNLYLLGKGRNHVFSCITLSFRLAVYGFLSLLRVGWECGILVSVFQRREDEANGG
jgi:hypothetical protein